ncbi:MAG: SusD/RagB family nutrient-binding outer membrane lipoprotein [Pseudarcicella sp.]|nr:SusD/RagB family nutrient-binding outer membrane lipoprotein [Pseudarcicella sp.]MBP6410726.1 SusD/RagB family nutrient-binding outer membrane lipoprotein [Pseudarcicella sp.]
MKNIKHYIILFVVFFAINSCEKWLEVNEDPNNPSVVPTALALPAAQASVMAATGGDIAALGGLWSQHWTQNNVSSQYKNIDGYALNANDFDRFWSEMYGGGLYDLESIKKQALASGNNHLALQCIALQSFGFQLLADFFDKIPLVQAFQLEKFPQPIYNEGPEVYSELLKRLDEALALDFSKSISTAALKTDLIFGASSDGKEQLDKWKKFTNTLKLKMYLRQTNSPNKAIAIASIKKMLSDSTKFLNTHASITKFIDETTKSNPLFENSVRQLNTPYNLTMSNTLYSYLLANNDLSRIDAYFIKGKSNPKVYYGLIQGDYEAPTQEIPEGFVSTINLKATDPFYFFSLDQVNFMLAEAYLIAGDAVKAKEYYNNGVKDGYAKFGILFDSQKIETGGVYAFPTNGNFEDQLKAIITQKWVAAFKQGYESFFDQARTGYPANSPLKKSPKTYLDGSWLPEANYVPGEWTQSLNASTKPGEFPKRILYSSVSKDNNVNVPKGEKITDKVWWMK